MSRKIACLTLDMEPDYGDPEGSIRLLEDPDYFERYVSIINQHGAKVTMFTVTSLFERFGKHFERLAQRIPLEYAAHSHNHDPSNGANREEVEKSSQVIRSINSDVPLGYRAPYGQISKEWLTNLLDLGFEYDSSVYPSFRPGKFGYSNLHMPNIPFRVTHAGKSLIEFPFTSLSGVRIVFALSYVKLFGWGIYSTIWKVFGLPEIVLALSHPQDFYFHQLKKFHPFGAEKFALSRNATRAFDYFDKMLSRLVNKGYQFGFLSDALEHVQADTNLQAFSLADWK